MDGGSAMTPDTPAAVARERPPVVEKLWPPAPRSVGRARRFLTRHLEAWGLPQLTENAELIVSELVTNAIAHAHPPYGRLIATRLERLECGVRIEVHDADDGKPERREASVDSESGRGLTMVDILTRGQWGVSDRKGPGKMVWAVCTEDPHDTLA
jgi:anti-sigma regulatory factor (Ser/Thr protein kinase)